MESPKLSIEAAKVLKECGWPQRVPGKQNFTIPTKEELITGLGNDFSSVEEIVPGEKYRALTVAGTEASGSSEEDALAMLWAKIQPPYNREESVRELVKRLEDSGTNVHLFKKDE